MNARGDQTRAKLIQATIDVVAEVGYGRATTRAIAEAAGVAEGTIYRHYADKRQLFFAAVFDRNAAVLDWVTALPGRAGKATVRDNLREALIRLGQLRSDLLPLELALRGDPELSAPLGAPDQRAPATGDDGGDRALPGPPAFVAAYLAAEQTRGRVRADVDTKRTAVVMLAMLFGIAMLPSTDDGMDTALIDTAVDTILAGIGAREA
jgi:AcrR family transcriptional regulator